MNNKISEKIDIHSLNTNLLKALWVIDCLTIKEKDRFTQSDIVSRLIENCGVETSIQAINMALTSKTGKKLTNKNRKGFKIMQSGINFLLNSTANNEVYFFESGTEFKTKRIELKSLFANNSSNIYLCDSYIDINTLDVVHGIFPKEFTVKILTQNIIDKPDGSFKRHIESLIRDGYNLEIGVYDKNEMHDRYIITEKKMFLSGNSLNFLGKKESFIIKLGEDMRRTVLEVFNRRWKIAEKI